MKDPDPAGKRTSDAGAIGTAPRRSKQAGGDGLSADTPSKGSRVGKTRVLIIDDSETARMLIRYVLTDAGFETFELPTAIGATRVLVQENIQVAVVDISMPGLSGDKLIEVLRRHPKLSQLVIVIVSGKNADELELLRTSSKADAVLSKSDVRESLVTVISGQMCRVSTERLPALGPLAPEPSAGRWRSSASTKRGPGDDEAR